MHRKQNREVEKQLWVQRWFKKPQQFGHQWREYKSPYDWCQLVSHHVDCEEGDNSDEDERQLTVTQQGASPDWL